MVGKIFTPDRIASIVVGLFILILWFLPTGFPTNEYEGSLRAEAMVLETNNTMLFNTGMILQGDQTCTMKILNGPFKGQIVEGVNRMRGKMEMDKVFLEGDRALVVLDYEGDQIRFANIIDHYRITTEIILFGAFILLLIGFAGWTGAQALLSFTLTVVMIWKILIPGLLRGWNPIGISMIVVVFLTICIIILVGGINRKSTAAIIGSLMGTGLTCLLAILFGNAFKIHGAVMPFSESLLYSGYAHLNLTEIFIAGIFLASSGALMDLAMDIAAAVYEIVQKNPQISAKEAIQSGFTIGRAVIGTMTTTLLLAYSGGYVALMMVFMAQGTPIINILNLRYVGAEILHTLVGSFGLVTVAPFTAVISGILFTKTSVRQILTKEMKP